MMKTTPYYIYRGTRLLAGQLTVVCPGIRKLLMVFIVPLFMVSCVTSDDPLDSGSHDVTLAFCVSTNRATTRMTEEVTQQYPQVGNYYGMKYRGIQDLWLFPCNGDSPVASLSGNAIGSDTDMNLESSYYLNYCNNKAEALPISTNHFLCYCRAVPNGTYFNNGYLKTSITNAKNIVTISNVSFSPEIIINNVSDEIKEEAATTRDNIATYLTNIANTIKGGGDAEFFRKFVNEGHVIACSSDYTLGLVNDLYTRVNALVVEAGSDEAKMKAAILAAIKNGVTFDETKVTALGSDMSGYPASINLPDGAAVVKWNTTAKKFEPQLVTTTEANINSLDRFVYPAELYYYTYSTIKTSVEYLKDYLNMPWDDDDPSTETVLKKYTNNDATIDGSEVSIAIKNELNYAVGCLQVGLVTSKTLDDAAATPKTITLGATTFPLTAIFVSGQYPQGYDFTPKDATDERIIYDNVITGFSMGAAPSEVPSSGELPNYTNTLVLQSKDGATVRFALEFTNDSGEDFEGANGIVFAGTKFYMVGTIEVTTGHTGDKDYMNRVFTKDRVTRGIVNISSLKQAYTYLPDLLDPRLEIGIKLVPEWIQATTTNVAL